MEKRIFAAVLISIALLWGWAVIAPKLFPELAKKPVPAAKSAPAPTTTTQTQTATTTAAAAPAAEETAAAPVPKLAAAPRAPIAAARVQSVVIKRAGFIATFSNRGGELVSFKLNNYKQDNAPVELVKARDASRSDFPFAIETTNAALTRRLNTALFAVNHYQQNGGDVIEFRYASADGVAATKTFRFPDDYLFSFAVAVSPATPYRVAIGPGIRTLGADEKDSQFTITGNGVVQRDDSLKVIRREKSPSLDVFDSVQFIGITDNYFLSVLRPEHSGSSLFRAIDFGTGKDKRREIYAAVNAAPDGIVSGEAFFGPKETALVDRYGLEKTLQYGTFSVIARWFLIALKWINGFVHNWGWSIIVLTIVIKIALYPLQHKWMLSM